MKIDKVKLKNAIEEIIAYGAAEAEEVDVTTKKVMDQINELIIAVEEK